MKALVASFLLLFIFCEYSFAQVLKTASKEAVATNKSSKKIIVYGSDTCHYCLDAKSLLKKQHIDFIYYDVDINITRQREMLVKMQKAGLPIDNLSLPVVHKNDEIFMNNGDFDAFLKRLTE